MDGPSVTNNEDTDPAHGDIPGGPADATPNADRLIFVFRVRKPAADGPSSRTKTKAMINKVLLWYQFSVMHGKPWGVDDETVTVRVDPAEEAKFRRGVYSLTLQSFSEPEPFIPLLFSDYQHAHTFQHYWSVPFPSNLSFRTLDATLSNIASIEEISWIPDHQERISIAHVRFATDVQPWFILDCLLNRTEWRMVNIFVLDSERALTHARCDELVANLRETLGRTQTVEIYGGYGVEVGSVEQAERALGMEVAVEGERDRLKHYRAWNGGKPDEETLLSNIDHVLPQVVHPNLPPIDLNDHNSPPNLKALGYFHPTAFQLPMSEMTPPELRSPEPNADISSFTNAWLESQSAEHENRPKGGGDGRGSSYR